MKKSMKKGFTLIEIALFLAVTGMLFVGIVAGVQNSMFQQRYNDAVQSFAEFLRTVYSQTLNVENPNKNGGQDDDWAIYGKLVTFGESNTFVESATNDDRAIFSYTVVGEIDDDDDFTSKTVLDEFKNRNLRVLLKDGEKLTLAGLAEQYFPRWEARIETTRGWENGGYEEFKGAILVVRHPRFGAVYTYVLKGETVEINAALQNVTSSEDPLMSFFSEDEDSGDGFQLIGSDGLDFCVDPNGGRQGARRDVRIISRASSASGVEIIGQDEEGNKCEP